MFGFTTRRNFNIKFMVRKEKYKPEEKKQDSRFIIEVCVKLKLTDFRASMRKYFFKILKIKYFLPFS